MDALTKRLLKLPPQTLALMVMELDEKLRASSAVEQPIAIVGLSCRFPGGATSSDAYWNLLSEGRQAASRLPEDRWDPESVCKPDDDASVTAPRGACVDDVTGFDAEFFGLSVAEATALDPQHRLALELCWEALENAGTPSDALMGSASGVFLGMSSRDYADRQIREGRQRQIGVAFGTGTSPSVAAGRIAYLLGTEGPALVVDTACSSSLVALHLACRSLASHECDLALSGGVHLILAAETALFLSRAGVLDPDGVCRPFDARASGYVRGEGGGMFVLKRLADARRDNDRIRAVIYGTAVRQDGRSNGLKAPNGRSLEAMMASCLAKAGWRGDSVDYVEAHGTGTLVGDAVEATSIGRAFGSVRTRGPCLIGSVKSNIGHLEAASGVASVMKAVLAIERSAIPPTPGFEEPNPRIAFDDLGLAVAREAVAWPAREGPRRAAVNSLSWSGTNAHVLLEEAPARPFTPVDADSTAKLLVLSARNEGALRGLAARYAAWMNAHASADDLRDLCYTAAVRRSHYAFRLGVVGASAQELEARLQAFARGKDDEVIVWGRVPRRRRVLAWVFPAPIGNRSPSELDLQLETRGGSDSVLRRLTSDDWASLERAPEGERRRLLGILNQVAKTRPWQQHGPRPAVVVGWGDGELSAALVAGALGVEDLIRTVCTDRGRYGTTSRTPESRAGDIEWLSPSLGGTPASEHPSLAHWWESLGSSSASTHEERACALLRERGEGDLLVYGDCTPPDPPRRVFLEHHCRMPEGRLRAVAELFVLGHRVSWPVLFPNGYVVEAPTYPWQRRSYWYTLADASTRRGGKPDGA